MFTDILWRFLILRMFVLGALFHVTWQYMHPQEQFCTSEFVILVHTRKSIECPRGMPFPMEIKRIYKGDARALSLIQNRFVMLEIPRTCAIYFLQSEDYVIFGYSKNGNLYTESCYGNLMWSMAPPFFKHALETDYRKNCACYKALPTKFNAAKMCYLWYSYMEWRGKSCSWANTRDLHTCQQIFG